MEIKSLDVISQEDIITCLLTAFSDYFVVLPDDFNYWKTRYKAAQIDWSLSFGMFDGEKLVGFIINGFDVHEGNKTAYNSGTGVLPDYRGKAIVDRLYAHAIPEFRKAGVKKCLLEVICENERALKVYKRIGFDIKRRLYSFKGTIPPFPKHLQLQHVSFKDVLAAGLYEAHHYSWDNLAKPVEISGTGRKSFFVTSEKGNILGYFLLAPGGLVVQIGASEKTAISDVLMVVSRITSEVRFGNIPAHRTELIKELKSLGFENTVDQYEMEYFLN